MGVVDTYILSVYVCMGDAYAVHDTDSMYVCVDYSMYTRTSRQGGQLTPVCMARK